MCDDLVMRSERRRRVVINVCLHVASMTQLSVFPVHSDATQLIMFSSEFETDSVDSALQLTPLIVVLSDAFIPEPFGRVSSVFRYDSVGNVFNTYIRIGWYCVSVHSELVPTIILSSAFGTVSVGSIF